jgi:hypothetical protein
MSCDKELDLVFTPILTPTREVLDYPFSFIRNDGGDGVSDEFYYIKDFCKGIIGEEPCDPGNFPHNIVEFYWIHEGAHDEEAWTCLCRLDNGYYAFYVARCDYTGFDCQGEMILYVARDRELLFYQGLTEAQRKYCLLVKREKADLNKICVLNSK